MHLYPVLLWASLRSQLAYRGSVALEIPARLWITAVELVAVVVLVDQARDLAGFGRLEIVYLYGVAVLSNGIAELLTDGVSEMPQLVRTGALDTILVRPVPSLVQVLACECRTTHFGRMLQGVLAIAAALIGLGWHPTALGALMLGVNVVSAAAVYTGIFIAEGATCVFTVQSTEAFNAFSYGGVEMTRYPVPIYRRWLRNVFLWVVPVGLASYHPALVVLGHDDVLGLPWFVPYLAPVAATAFLLVCIGYWQFAIDRYRGTGS